MTQTIMVVDDEKRLVSLVESYLTQEGYRVATAYTGKEALLVARKEKPDLIILDIMMPEMDGYEFMEIYRRESKTPIIVLTARVEEEEQVIGLELGADDYVTKPFRPRALMARVRAVLRRAEGEPVRAETRNAGDLTLDLGKHSARLKDRTLELTPTEFDSLAVLMQNPGRAFTRLQLLDQVQGEAFEGYERTIDAHVKNLRQKIERDPKSPQYILTVFGVGYKFVDDESPSGEEA